MKRIRLKAPVVVKGYPNVKVGDVIEIQNNDAQVLLGMGAAELVGPEDAPDGLTTGRGVIESREPVVEAREPVAASVETPPGKPSRRKPAT